MDNSVPYDLQRLLRLANSESHDSCEILELAKAINRRSNLWSDPGFSEEFGAILTPIAILSSDIFATSRTTIKKENSQCLQSASSLILTFMVSSITESNVKKFLNPLSSLCTGSPSLDSSEKTEAIEILNGAKDVLPPGFVLDSNQKPPKPPMPLSLQSVQDQENQDGINRPQTDLTSSLLRQLRSPYESKADHTVEDDFHTFTTKNINHLRALDTGEILTDICLKLPHLSKFITQWENAVNGEDQSVSLYLSEMHKISALLEDVDIAWKSLTLPILEPLTSEMLQKVAKIVMGCLVASVSVASSPLNSDEMESASIEIVENSLELFNTILTTIRQSTRAGGHILQNYIMMGAWVLTSGLLVQLAAASDPTAKIKRPIVDLLSHGLNLNKVQQRFNVLSVALASEALTLTSLLLEDLNSETTTTSRPDEKTKKTEEIATLELYQTFKASQRVALILNSVPLIPLLFNVAFVSFKKGLVSMDSKAKKEIEEDLKEEAENNDDDDDDSEPILGRWFEETLSLFPTEEKKANGSSKKVKAESSAQGSSTLLAKIEPSGFFVSLSSHIFIYLNKHMLPAENDLIKDYIKNGLAEAQMIVLADMIRDLEDHEKSYPELSNALACFMHNILAMGLLTHKLQNSLLSQLGVSPWTDATPWPLKVQPRALAVLAHVLLLRQQQSELDQRPITTVYTSIWEKVLSSLTEAVVEDDNTENEEAFDDLNAEHVQLLLFLFHALALMQKKQLLLYTANCIIKVSKVKKVTQKQVVHTSRLVLILEYIMKNLYEPPKSLINEVQQNIFKRHSGTELKFHPFVDIVSNIKEEDDEDDNLSIVTNAACKRFYNLFEIPSEFNPEVPKLDGLALSFILGTSESLKYAQLYQALIDNLDIAKSVDTDKKPMHMASIQYCFALSLRTLELLPPSIEFLESLAGAPYLNENGEADMSSILHSLIICHRLNDKQYAGWVKDSLVKQGQTTAKAEAILKNVTPAVSTFQYDLRILKQLLRSLNRIMTKRGALVSQEKMATFFDLLVLDATVVHLHMELDKARTNNDPNLKSYIESTAEVLLPLLDTFSSMSKSAIIHNIKEDNEDEVLNENAKETLLRFLSISGTRCSETATLAMTLEEHCPSSLRQAMSTWQDGSLFNFATLEETRKSAGMPGEVYIYSRIQCHLGSLSLAEANQNMISLKQNLYTVARFAKDLFVWCPESSGNLQKEIASVLFPLIMDSCTEILSNLLSLVLEKHTGIPDSEEFSGRVFKHVLENTFETLVTPVKKSFLDGKILIEVVHYMEDMLEKSTGRTILDEFFSGRSKASGAASNDLVHLLMSMSKPDLSPDFTSRVLKFFNKLFAYHGKYPQDEATARLCSSLSKVTDLPQPQLSAWLRHVVGGLYEDSSTTTTKDESAMIIEENCQLLHCLTNFIVDTNSTIPEEVSLTILNCLIPMASEMLADNSKHVYMFQDVMMVLTTLANGCPIGHVQLFRACAEWMQKNCRSHINKSTNDETNQEDVMVENTCRILEYMCDVIAALKLTNENEKDQDQSNRPSSPSNEHDKENSNENDNDWIDELNDDDDSAGEDSDDEGLNSKLCTFTQTQKEFMNQHWYHCHTCKMVDGVGVCTVCAKVCHASCDVTYSKHGSFFCDCGAKEDGSCTALVKRTSSATNTSTMEAERPSMPSSAAAVGYEPMLASSLRRRPSSPGLSNLNASTLNSEEKKPNDKEISRQKLAKKLNGWKEVLLDEISHSGVASNLLEILKTLVPIVKVQGDKNSSAGRSANLREALASLHRDFKTCEFSDQLMVPTLGSQEGAFENVRMNYTGDQGQTIRQLMNAHVVRRVVMCCLSSGKRQHLAVAHEKGKLTVLQLSALLKQADSSQKKLTLTRLASAPVPFTVLSVVSNPCNEDYLAVTGLKDCHVLTFNSSGSVSEHLVLHPQLDANNFIIKAVWMPGSQTELALITADFVKVYDLGKDVLSPQYFLLVPSGKVRDCTLAFMNDGLRYTLIMSSAGHIYFQALSQEASAVNGPFYITNTLEVDHPALREANTEQIGGGGISIYYSQVLQVLFFSYAQGLNFMASMTKIQEDALKLSISQLYAQKPSTGSSTNKNNSGNQPLCQWGEVQGHPGLITAFLQASNNPVVIMVTPDCLFVQEIKIGSKAKIVDMVAIRHGSGATDQRTTLILLCEDGSLKIYMAGEDSTGFWLSPQLHPMASILSQVKPPRKKRSPQNGQKGQRFPHGTLTFPIDFFEHCSIINDVEYGGNDLLQVYNVQQVKHRLQTASCYIANTKPNGFALEVTNNDNSFVVVGIRVMLGGVDINRVPSFIEVHGRNLPVNLTRARWFDFPLTRDETLGNDKKVTINFGPSFDPAGVSIVDSVQIYGKTKEAFGWPEDQDEFTGQSQVGSAGTSKEDKTSTGQDANQVNGTDVVSSSLVNHGPYDKLVSVVLEILEGCFTIEATPNNIEDHKKIALGITTNILAINSSTEVDGNNKALLSTLFTTKQHYHQHKDETMLKQVAEPDKIDHMDVEKFEKMVYEVRTVATTRPVNLNKFSETYYGSSMSFITKLSNWFWELLENCPVNAVVGTLGQPGLTYVDATVQALLEVFHAVTTSDAETVPEISKLYAKFLVADNLQVSFAAKQAIIRVLRPRLRRRRVFIPSPPPPAEALTSLEDAPAPVEPEAMEVDQEFHDANEGGAGALGLGPGGIPLGGIAGNLDALLGGLGGAQNPDVPGGEIDDEAMVELAIALSLQEQGEGVDLANLQQGLQQLAHLGPGLQGFPALQGLAGMLGGAVGGLPPEEVPVPVHHGEVVNAVEQGNYSDATASAPGSDDDEEEEEGSTAALDGSTLRTPPVEPEPEAPGSGAGSESGASVNESIVGEQTISGRSSAYEAEVNGDKNAINPSSRPLVQADNETSEWEATNAKLHSLRMGLLNHLIELLPDLRDVSGPRCIPFMQVILMLTTDLDGNEESDCQTFDSLLNSLVNELKISEANTTEEPSQRSHLREYQLVILRLFSVLMSRSKSWQQNGLRTSMNSSFVSKVTASALVKANCTNHCLLLLTNLLTHWKAKVIEEGSVKVSSSLLKSQPNFAPPDMGPFFLKQYVKSHAHDIFEAYPQLLTEMALKLPYQYFKIIDTDLETVRVDPQWHHVLCEYMMIHQIPYVRRPVRKLMLFICGTKENYRELRDLHTLASHTKNVKEILDKTDDNADTSKRYNLPYDTLLQLIEHLKACVDIASSRTINWQKFCVKNPKILAFLLKISFKLDDGVNPIVLQLLQNALCFVPSQSSQNPAPGVPSSSSGGRKRAFSPIKRSKALKNEDNEDTSKTSETLSFKLIQSLSQHVAKDLLKKFVEKFLLECNTSSVRWQAHSLIVTLHKNSADAVQSLILDVLWDLWPQLPFHGRKAAQFVDLLGFFSIKTLQDEKKIQNFVHEAVGVLKSQNNILATHPNSNLYGNLSQLVEFNGYYLESDPCLVCNNPEVPYSSFKLSTLKVDTKYTTTTQIVKLSTSHSISKIALRIGDLKRQKMVRTINIYYNNRSVQAVVELKNRPTMWHKARKVSLTAGQTDIKIEFPLPIVACNLMIEYADFYENIQASSETLQCPRCSASVPANPGVCSNCGENVFQCHKCRSINYDEKDPFLCNACGFCKYAKFEYTLTSRPTCAVDPIENEDDRKKAILSINSLLDRADRVYRQLIGNKPILESLLLKISESGISDVPDNQGPTSSSNSHVNQWIQQLAQKYCGDCRNSFEELSKIIQKVMATRRELVAFDKKKVCAAEMMMTTGQKLKIAGRCYGCAAASVEHCLTLLRALATKPVPRNELYHQGLIQELMEFNLRRGTLAIRHEVRKLICLLTKDNREATNHLNKLLYDKIGMALKGHSSYPDLVESVRHEVTLLGVTVQREDSCWEQRLRCVLKIFIMATNEGKDSPTVVEYITLPCLKILHNLMRGSSSGPIPVGPPPVPNSKPKEEKEGVLTSFEGASLSVDKWLNEVDGQSYEDWQKRALRIVMKKSPEELKKVNPREMYLQEKYFKKWFAKTNRREEECLPLDLRSSSSWLKRVIFNPSSRMAREVACQMVESFCHKNYTRRKIIIEMLTTFLNELSDAGEAGLEFVCLYQRMIANDQWKFYLAIRGTLETLSSQIMAEIDKLNQLENHSLSSDLAQGFALKALTDILASFLSKDHIKRVFKGRLLSTVLHGYLSLRRLVVQRTKLVDQTQEKMLELLEDMTSGTVEETKNFMAICVQTIERYPPDDQLTPVFIFERLCNIIFPEETDTGEFFMTLEKDPQQEDFLQGRMLGNPYSSNDPDLAPNMREIKNKICTDCELVALLEDDNGMELLVNNKIISLDLPVKDVYQKVWLPVAQENEPMRIIYRMRGLLGDATEEFIENLADKENEDKDEEEIFKMANVMAENDGLKVMLERLAHVEDNIHSKQLMIVLLKLFGYCVKVRKNREKMLEPNLKTIPTLLKCVKLCLRSTAQDSAIGSQGQNLSEEVLQIMEKLLVEATTKQNTIEIYCNFASNGVFKEDIQELLEHAVNLKAGTTLHQSLLRVLPFLTYANEDKMALIIKHFEDILDFDNFNANHGPDEEAKMEAFVALCEGIERNEIGNTMKSIMNKMGIIEKCINFLTVNAPSIEAIITLKADDPFWKDYVSKPALKYVLRALAGVASKHSPTQMELATKNCIPILHQMEQVSTDEHVGSLAEAVLESLKGHPEAENRVKEVRNQTKAEKKKLAMAMRAKQLKKFGLKANDQGQVKADNSILKQFVSIAEESGLCCNICREGYKFQPNKVLAIYTFTQASIVDEGEVVASGTGMERKTPGYSTVTHFNLVHVDCHMAALRLQRGRDEWESAILQNANTRCNGLLPIWGPQVAESSFASCLARHNTYLYEATRHRDIGYISTIHDLKLLLLRFAQDKSFSSESGGGGPQSNMNLVPYLVHMALYVLNTTRAVPREEKNLVAFLELPKEKWLENCYVADGAYFYSALGMLLMSPSRWRKHRVTFLQRLLLLAHVRSVSPQQRCQSLADKNVKPYATYKLVILYFALIDQLYETMFNKVPTTANDAEWPTSLADWIRHNDDNLLKSSAKILSIFQDDLYPATSVEEIIDVCGLMGEIPSPASFLLEILSSVP